MSTSSTIPPVAHYGNCAVVRFSTDDYAPHERLDACREIYGRTLSKRDIEPLSAEGFRTEATLWRMPGLGIAKAQRSAAIYRLPREFIDSDDVFMTIGLTSACEARQLGRALDLKPGEASVMTASEPACLKVPSYGQYINVRAPRRILSSSVADLDAAYCRSIPAHNPALRLMIRYIGLIEKTEGFAAPDLRQQVVTHIHDLMTLAIGATRDAAEIARSRGGEAARLRAIKQDIANRLDQPDLSVATIAAQHRVKARWVQRQFEREGTTFTEYVLTQRLERAHRLMTDPGHVGLKISAIALDAGFGDLSYFNRAFRRRYGVTPSELRAAAVSGE
ncbi:AraC family transcriptional regulator [Vineibacter terrae]|nr:AraC family transcriptional regulator [Vineibacter terrae]